MAYTLITPTPEAIRSHGVLAYLTPAKRNEVYGYSKKRREDTAREIKEQIEREKKNSPKVPF
jgi:hypothetical protein